MGVYLPANGLYIFTTLRLNLLRWSGALAHFGSFFSFPLDAGFLKELSAAELRQDTFLLYALIETSQ